MMVDEMEIVASSYRCAHGYEMHACELCEWGELGIRIHLEMARFL
jgi:hypothetical protein